MQPKVKNTVCNFPWGTLLDFVLMWTTVEVGLKQGALMMWRRKSRSLRLKTRRATLNTVPANGSEFAGQKASVLKCMHHIKRAAPQHLNRSLVVYWHFPLDWVVLPCFPVGFSSHTHTHTLNFWTTEGCFPFGRQKTSIPYHKKVLSTFLSVLL